jgi:carbamoyl-phosphate synthase large subunit
VLVDRFLDDAVEIDVDALYDGERALPRRRDGAHRGGRHPLRRLGLRAAADHARRDDVAAVRQATGELAARIGVRG